MSNSANDHKSFRKEYFYIFCVSIIYFFLTLLKSYLYYIKDPTFSVYEMFYFCNFFALVLCLIIFFGSVATVKKFTSIIFVGAVVAQMPWIVFYILDYFGLENFQRFKGLDAFLVGGQYLKYSLSIFSHIFLIPFTFFIISKIGFYKHKIINTCVYSFLYFAVSYFLARVSGVNINCLIYPCDGIYGTTSIFSHGYVYSISQIFYDTFIYFIAYKVFIFISNLLYNKKKAY